MSYTFAVPDIHGRFDLLKKAIRAIEKSAKKGTVVFLGDYIDRGPDSKAVLDCLMKGPQKEGWKWICLKGNHEDLCVRGLGGDRNYYMTWLSNGGRETLESLDGTVLESYIEWMGKLPVYHQDKNRLFVHAGCTEKYELDRQEEIMLWSRINMDFDYGYKGKYVVHGHTPVRNGPVIMTQRCNLDTYAVRTGRLVVGVFNNSEPGPPMSIIEVKENG